MKLSMHLRGLLDGMASIGESFLPAAEQRRRHDARFAAWQARRTAYTNAELARHGLPPIDLTPAKTVEEAFARDRAALAGDFDRACAKLGLDPRQHNPYRR